MLSVYHGVSASCFEILSRRLVSPIIALLLFDWHQVKLAFSFLMRFLVLMTLYLTCLARAWLTRCPSPCCNFVVLVRVCPLTGSFYETPLTRETSLLVGPGNFLAHLRPSLLRILYILLAESAMAITAVSTATSAASSIMIREVGWCTELVVLGTLANRPLVVLSLTEFSQVICAVSIRLTGSPLKILHRATLGTCSGS